MAAASIVTLTDANFTEEVLACEIPVLVDFWAAWCGPCRMIAPAVDQLAETVRSKWPSSMWTSIPPYRLSTAL